jgi:hypothetical protein
LVWDTSFASSEYWYFFNPPMLSKILAAAGLLAAGVSGHGAVTSYSIGGVTYPGYCSSHLATALAKSNTRYEGYSPASSPATIERQWPSYNPILSITDSAMRCNGGTSAALSAPVAAGGTVTAIWAQWTHQQGPVMVWMYKCSGAFSACDGSGAGWFKIDEMGMTAPPLTGTSWGTAVVYANLKWTSTIPASLAPGNYLIRHELLALHQAYTPQWYAECAQLQVTGSGTATPSGSYLTSIPAYASANDPGVYVSRLGREYPSTADMMPD